ncbi:MAG: hypothetical protein L0H94_01410 [Nitrospira sp.]|nr:hypothetical protein [Nitrospira sp.]
MRIYLSILVSVLGLGMSMAYAGSPESTETTEITSWGDPVPSDQLDTQRGGMETDPFTINANILNANLFDNVAIDNVTGNNTITGNAFAGMSGLATIFQNTGNNVIMQQGTTLHLTVK